MTSTQTIISSPNESSAPASEQVSVQKQAIENESLYQRSIQCKLSIGAADDPLEKEADEKVDCTCCVVTLDEEEVIIKLFTTAAAADRPTLYRMVEGTCMERRLEAWSL